VVGLEVLKNKLSESVRLAAGGETVLVADRDRVVAELGPPGPGRAALVSDALLAEAVRAGGLQGSLRASPAGAWAERKSRSARGNRRAQAFSVWRAPGATSKWTA
jgi:antitoxin (DNA-binding transcriptional repressor) of toxin-antitoxin stability system